MTFCLGKTRNSCRQGRGRGGKEAAAGGMGAYRPSLVASPFTHQQLTLKLEAANLRLDEEKHKQEQCLEQLKEQEQVIERMRAEVADANKKAEAAAAAAASSVDSATVLAAAAAAATEIESLKTVVKELKEKEQSAQLAAAAEVSPSSPVLFPSHSS